MIILPSFPGAQRADPYELDFGGILTPDTGAETQRINRKGNRWGASFVLPPLDSADLGRIWVNRLVRGKKQGARIAWPLGDFNPGVPGAFTVDGAGQAGTSLVLKGGAPGYQFKEGQPFNVVIGGRYYFDFIAADVVANGSGAATIQLTEMLRAEPANGDAIVLAQPMIEGWVIGDRVAWELAVDRNVGLGFEIQEAR